ncbi:glycosyltransferase family 4 protein [Aerococcaceae bacterium 50-4]
MSNKKILFLVNHDVVIYNFRLELILQLLENGYEIHISSPYGKKIDELVELGCVFHEIKIDRRGRNLFKDLNLIKKYYELLRKIRPLVTLTFTIKPNLYGGLICRVLSVPYISNITGLGSSLSGDTNSILKQILKVLYRTSLKEAECVFFQNKNNLEIFKSKKIPMKKYKLLPGSGVNIDKFPYSMYPNNKKVHIYYFGRLMKDKGTYELIEAAEILKTKNIQIHLVGFSEDSKLSELIDLYHKKGILINHGYQEKIFEYIKQADAIIQPSYHEGMSNVLLEAASSGRPVLASNIPGCQEIIDDGITGYLFEAKDVCEIVTTIQKFSRLSKNERRIMGQKGHMKIKKEFSRELVTNSYIREINNINN